MMVNNCGNRASSQLAAVGAGAAIVAAAAIAEEGFWKDMGPVKMVLVVKTKSAKKYGKIW